MHFETKPSQYHKRGMSSTLVANSAMLHLEPHHLVLPAACLSPREGSWWEVESSGLGVEFLLPKCKPKSEFAHLKRAAKSERIERHTVLIKAVIESVTKCCISEDALPFYPSGEELWQLMPTFSIKAVIIPPSARRPHLGVRGCCHISPVLGSADHTLWHLFSLPLTQALVKALG